MPLRSFATPRESDLGLRRISNLSGLSISVLPNGCLFAIEHGHESGRTLINQIQGSPLCGGIGRLFLRLGAAKPVVVEAVGAGAVVSFGAADDRFAWEGAAAGVRHSVSLWLHPAKNVWLWRVQVENDGAEPVTCDATLVQDVGLGARGFVMGNEAYASQYIDHHVARHPRCGPVVMSRQNLVQGGVHPWVAHGCLEGAAGFATDAMQLLGPACRDAGRIDPVRDLPSERLQHEVACPMIRSPTVALKPGGQATWTFFGLFEPDHPEASSDADLERIDQVRQAAGAFLPRSVAPGAPVRGLLQDASPLAGLPFDEPALAGRYPERAHEERAGGRLVSFFVPEGALNRHVVLREKERTLARRHGAILRSGQGMLLDETTMCATCWMHGVFASLLTIGNTSFHRLFSASRDPYNITRSGGLRILIEAGAGWQLLAEPSVFEMGLSDCRWIYRLEGCTVTVRAVASGDDPAMQWRIAVEGAPCRFLVFGHLVLGERELDHAGRVAIDADNRRIAFRPDPASLWGQRYPDAVYHLVTGTPEAIEAIGGDELLYADGQPRSGGFVALRTRATDALDFAVVGALADPAAAEALAAKYAAGVDDAASLAPAVAVLAARHPQPAPERRGRGRCRGQHAAALAGAERDGAPDGAAWPRAVRRRRLGHARRLPGAGRVPARARARRAGQGDPADRLRAAAGDPRRLAAVVHARALRADPRPAQPWRRHRLAAEGALRLRRSHRRSRRFSTSRSPGGARTISPRPRSGRRWRRMWRSLSPPCASGSSPARS